jgi:hypothetical protein
VIFSRSPILPFSIRFFCGLPRFFFIAGGKSSSSLLKAALRMGGKGQR